MLTLNFSPKSDSQILITMTHPKAEDEKSLGVEGSGEIRQSSTCNVISWFSAIFLLRNFPFASSIKHDWEKRAISLREKLEECDTKSKDQMEKATRILLQSLKIDAESEENELMKFTEGFTTKHFVGQFQVTELLFNKTQDIKYHKDLSDLARDFYFSKFSFEKSSWTPHAKPIKLKETLSKQGPLLIFGRFGQKFYAEEAHKLKEQFLGRDVFAWNKGAKRLSESHVEAIIVIGAWIGNNDSRVYFYDPCDSKRKFENHKIFVISFNNLLTNITNTRLELFSQIKGKDLDYTPSFTQKTFGKIPLFDLLSSNQKHPDMEYDEKCKSVYGYYDTLAQHQVVE